MEEEMEETSLRRRSAASRHHHQRRRAKKPPPPPTTNYDDVFGGPPRHAVPFSGVPDDYSEVFGGVSASCSIPFLDLPTGQMDGWDCASGESVHGVDYVEIFGRCDFADFAVPYEQLFERGTRDEGELEMHVASNNGRSSVKDRSDLRTIDPSTFIQEYSNEDNIPYLEDVHFTSSPLNSDKIAKEYNTSYNKSSRSRGKELIHTTTCVPQPRTGFTQVVEPTDLLPEDPAPVSKDTVTHENSVKHNPRSSASSQSVSSEEAVSPEVPFLSGTDINLQTQLANLPPPARPPPPKFLLNEKQKTNMFPKTDSVSHVSTDAVPPQLHQQEKPKQFLKSDSLPPNFDFVPNLKLDKREKPKLKAKPKTFLKSDSLPPGFGSELDAMKEAMEFAQARLKTAKELHEKKREGKITELPLKKKHVKEENLEGFEGEKLRVLRSVTLASNFDEGGEVIKLPGSGLAATQVPHKLEKSGKWKSDEEFYELTSIGAKKESGNKLGIFGFEPLVEGKSKSVQASVTSVVEVGFMGKLNADVNSIENIEVTRETHFEKEFKPEEKVTVGTVEILNGSHEPEIENVTSLLQNKLELERETGDRETETLKEDVNWVQNVEGREITGDMEGETEDDNGCRMEVEIEIEEEKDNERAEMELELEREEAMRLEEERQRERKREEQEKERQREREIKEEEEEKDRELKLEEERGRACKLEEERERKLQMEKEREEKERETEKRMAEEREWLEREMMKKLEEARERERLEKEMEEEKKRKLEEQRERERKLEEERQEEKKREKEMVRKLEAEKERERKLEEEIEKERERVRKLEEEREQERERVRKLEEEKKREREMARKLEEEKERERKLEEEIEKERERVRKLEEERERERERVRKLEEEREIERERVRKLEEEREQERERVRKLEEEKEKQRIEKEREQIERERLEKEREQIELERIAKEREQKERERKLEEEREKQRRMEKEREEREKQRRMEKEREEKETAMKLEAERKRVERERADERERATKLQGEKAKERRTEARKSDEEREGERRTKERESKTEGRKSDEEREKVREKKSDEEREREWERRARKEREREEREREREKEEREREREKDRLAVERATQERAERIAIERITAARQRAFLENREKEEINSRGGGEGYEKKKLKGEKEEREGERNAREARQRAERAAVERATAEARERAIEKAKAEVEKERDRLERFKSFNKTSTQDYAQEVRFKRTQSDSALNQGDGESALRHKARLERQQRTAQRAAKALAEKNLRDIMAQREQAERDRIAEHLDAEVKRWSSGKEGNLRALLSTLQYILGQNSGWQPIHLTEVITGADVKKAYRKATLYVHPDKLQQRGASIQQKYICEKVFDLLKEAWNKFNSEER